MRSSASMCVCLASLLTGCVETRTITVTEYQQLYLPDRFLVPCEVVEGPGNLTYREMAALAAKRKSSVVGCNLQLESARKYQADLRAKEAVKAIVSEN